jgi:hypothetical protein
MGWKAVKRRRARKALVKVIRKYHDRKQNQIQKSLNIIPRIITPLFY